MSLTLDDLHVEVMVHLCKYLDIECLRQLRLVSKIWNAVVAATRRPSFACNLTDESLVAAIRSTEHLSSIKMSNFSGKGNVASSTRGTGRLFADARTIAIQGGNVDPSALKRMIGYANPSLKELVFSGCTKNVIKSVLSPTRSFDSLQKLKLWFDDTLPSPFHTLMLNQLGLPQNGALPLPCLEYFDLSYAITDSQHNCLGYRPDHDDMLEHYLATAKLVRAYRNTLKTIIIQRSRRVQGLSGQVLFEFIGEELDDLNREMDECRVAFAEVKLQKLYISNVDLEGNFPWTFESMLLSQQSNLNQLTLIQKVFYVNWLPPNISTLTSVTLMLPFVINFDAFDLGLFAECPNLETLKFSSSHVANVEMLPKSLKKLYFFVENRSFPKTVLAQEQFSWIIHNMPNLEYFGAQSILEVDEALVIPALGAWVQTPEILRHLNRMGLDNVNEAFLTFMDFFFGSNVSLNLFQEMLAMPKMKEWKLLPHTRNRIAAKFGTELSYPNGPETTFQEFPEFQEYVRILEEMEDLTYNYDHTCPDPELTITKN